MRRYWACDTCNAEVDQPKERIEGNHWKLPENWVITSKGTFCDRCFAAHYWQTFSSRRVQCHNELNLGHEYHQ